MKNGIVIGGYYGFGSIGDDAVAQALIQELKSLCPDCEISILCAHPRRWEEKYRVRCVNRNDPAAVAGALLRARLYISGGGSLLQDGTSGRSLLYYCSVIQLAKAAGAKVFIYANGIGPLKNVKRAAAALRTADKVSVRDPVSLVQLKEMGICASLTSDPVFLIKPAKETENKALLAACGIGKNEYFTVSLRSCRGRQGIPEQSLLRGLRQLVQRGLKPVFVSMQDSCDLEICERAAISFDAPVLRGLSASALCGLQAGARLALGMRLHFLLTAAAAGTPVIPLSYDCKVENTLSYFGEAGALDAFDFSEDRLSSALRRALNPPPGAAEKQIKRARELAALAQADLAAAAELARSGDGSPALTKFSVLPPN